MRTVAIIQARLGSSRLPGKVLMDLGGQSVLQRVVSRACRCPHLHEVVVATSTAAQDDAIVAACRTLGVCCFRGNEQDVLDRYLCAAEAYRAEVCVRITSDCPLLDPEVSGHVIECFLGADPVVDYASNKIPQSYPRGLDTEVFSIDALRRAHRLATQAYERTHVTIFMYEHPRDFKLLSVVSDTNRADWRWTVDTQEDLEFIRTVYARLDSTGQFGWRDVVALLEREPQLREINGHIVQKAAREG
jgi:spore coat polysaccharide biosynthesis protein SpsF